MGTSYPLPPAVEDFPLTGERPCRIPLDVLYKNLFHGELFQGVMSMDRYGTEGIQGQIRVLPREGLFKSNPEPQFVLDPVLMDVAMHPLAGWHLEQPDQSGRILLPYELGDIRFYGPRPAVDAEMTSRGRIVHESPRRFTHTVEVVGPGNRLWCTMEKLKYWRFYLPFGEFNFHGPKDDYFLSENWLDAIGDSSQTQGELPTACCVGLAPPRDLQAPGMMLASARVTLTAEELRTFRKLELPDPRKSEWLFGRMAAKDAARILWRKLTGERMVPADIAITPDEDGKPVASPIGRERPENFPQISIAHTEGLVAALGSFDSSPGIDLERIVPREESFEKAAFSASERGLLPHAADERAEIITRFWCAKEAVSKAIGQGFVLGPQSLSVIEYDANSGEVRIELGPKLLDRLPTHFAVGPCIARTIRKEDFVVATILLQSERPCPAASRKSLEKSPVS
jgi:phosphopantetheinyl transferase